jgi:hypothetical protein
MLTCLTSLPCGVITTSCVLPRVMRLSPALKTAEFTTAWSRPPAKAPVNVPLTFRVVSDQFPETRPPASDARHWMLSW